MIYKAKNLFDDSFDVYANNYHSIRPVYPALLFQDMEQQCGINKRSSILEIGAGSGIATLELAKFSGSVTAIEPAPKLASILEGQTKEQDNVEIVKDTFEGFASKGKFDVVSAFTAFHWLDKNNRYERIDELLQDFGSLVLVWNSFFQSDSPVTRKVNEISHQILPEIYPNDSSIDQVNNKVLSKLNRREQEVAQNSTFSVYFLKKYLVNYNYDAETYVRLLNTFPKVIEVEEQKKNALFEEVSKVVKKHGKISVSVLTTMIVCQKKEYFLKEMLNLGKGA